MRSLQWDIFCKVIDNFGDIGVAWRLAIDLASRGQKVRLWADDASALAWMAPGGQDGVTLMPWKEAGHPQALSALDTAPCDVLVEAFGCDPAPEFIAACARIAEASDLKPVWINLEYLSAEGYAQRNHGLPSLVQNGPAAGWIKWFFYPGFTPQTGGLLREFDLPRRQAAFQRGAWLRQHGLPAQGEALVSLFCYEPPALTQLLCQLAGAGLNGQPVRLLVTAGRAQRAIEAALPGLTQKNDRKKGSQPAVHGQGLLSISYLPLLTQADFDHLLWACDINLVRGEDSLVRALWAGKPFIWQIYRQHDDVHLVKLEAFLDWLDAPASWRSAHTAWNRGDVAVEATDEKGAGPAPAALPSVTFEPTLTAWQSAARSARSRLLAQSDLTSRLLEFIEKNR